MVYYLVCGVILLSGGILLGGAILDWDWIATREKERPKGLGHFVYEQFGRKGYRVLLGFGGGICLVTGIFLLLV